MSRIEDFGEKIHGAAKDRWRAYGLEITNARTLDVLEVPLSRSFPEPSYGKLLDEGVDPWVVAFVRSARDMIPPKPRSRGVSSWASQVIGLRNICADLVEGRISRDRLVAKFSEPRYARLNAQIGGAISLYLAMGHGQSLKGFRLERRRDRASGDIDWIVTGKGRFGPRSRQILAEGATSEAAIEAFMETLGSAPPRRRSSTPKFKLYTYRSDPGKRVHIGVTIGRETVDLQSFADVASARAFLRDHEDLLVERLERLKRLPGLRLESNADRTGGHDLEGRDVTPEEFAATFRFRGVQFGNYVEGPRRQKDLNDTWVSLMDLSSVLGLDPSDLSLGGRLGIAFGARGRGGRGAALAHYEPTMTVINLTKARGAGSLAHEWFHALDNQLSAVLGAPASFATEGCTSPIARDFRDLIRTIRKLPLHERSVEVDRYRSTPYYQTSVEIAARSFEAWVKDELARKGVCNDHLVNITPEDMWRAECALLGRPEDSWPYPKPEELREIAPIFERIARDPFIRDMVRVEVSRDSAPSPF